MVWDELFDMAQDLAAPFEIQPTTTSWSANS